MAITTSDSLAAQAKEFSDAWPTEDTQAAPTPPVKNPLAFYTAEEKQQLDDDAKRAALKATSQAV